VPEKEVGLTVVLESRGSEREHSFFRHEVVEIGTDGAAHFAGVLSAQDELFFVLEVAHYKRLAVDPLDVVICRELPRVENVEVCAHLEIGLQLLSARLEQTVVHEEGV
jgi:hypothetical protein